MATWYVRTTGSDSAAGTSAATAFATVGKAMTNSSLAAGDTIYVGGGTYRISTTITPTSMASMTYCYGDTDGSKTGDAGQVVLTNYATNDSTAPTQISIFTFGNTNYWTIGKMTLIVGGAPNADLGRGVAMGTQGTTTATNLTFQDMTIFMSDASNASFLITQKWSGAAWNITVERCRLFANVQVNLPTSSTGADVNANIVFRNNISYLTNACYYFSTPTSNTYKMGGITIANCLLLQGDSSLAAVHVNSSNTSTTYPVLVYNCQIHGVRGIVAGTTGKITEDYNHIYSPTPRVNVTAGSNSKSDSSYNPRFSLGDEASYGGVVRPFGELVRSSPLLSWGGSTASAVPSDDINGITRPASGEATTSKSLGPYERSNSATRETTTTRTGGTAIKIAGPGYHDFELAVSPVSTNVSVWSYKDATYGTAATGPQLIITNAGEAGYAGTAITSAGGTGAWAAMTATFTPTSAGIVTVRLQSNATVGSAAAYFDDFSVT